MAANMVFKGSYYDGGFDAEPHGDPIDKFDPCTGEVLYRFYPGSVERAIESAAAVAPDWARVPLESRISMLQGYRQLLEQEAEAGAAVIARETGKLLNDARTEIKTMIRKVDLTIEVSLERIKPYGIQNGECVFRPRGVCAVLGPYNFPGHLPNGQIVPALLAGNTVVFKPSRHTPLVGQFITDLLDRVGCGPAFNLLQCDAQAGWQLARDARADAVLFTGSNRVGRQLKQLELDQEHKLVALEMGGINAAVIDRDADLQHAVEQCLDGAYGLTGQRCTATRKILVHKDVWQDFTARFNTALIGRRMFDEQGAAQWVGPLTTRQACEQYEHFIDEMRALRAHIEFAQDPSTLPPKGYYVSPAACFFADGAAFPDLADEIFFPAVQIEAWDDELAMYERIARTRYGLSASYFGKHKESFLRFRSSVRAGCVNWNRSTAGASSELPFGGMLRSGNDRPGGIMMIDTCVYPVASLWTE